MPMSRHIGFARPVDDRPLTALFASQIMIARLSSVERRSVVGFTETQQPFGCGFEKRDP
jgi:hypothetical protein